MRRQFCEGHEDILDDNSKIRIKTNNGFTSSATDKGTITNSNFWNGFKNDLERSNWYEGNAIWACEVIIETKTPNNYNFFTLAELRLYVWN